MIPWGGPPSLLAQLARSAAFEEAMGQLECIMPIPPSREVFVEECRRANLHTLVEVTPRDVVKRLIAEYMLRP